MGSEEDGKGVTGRALTREQQLLVGRILVSKPLPFRPKRFRFEWLSIFGGMTVAVILLTGWAWWVLSGRRASIVPVLAIGSAVNLLMGIIVLPRIRRRAASFIRLHNAFICPRCHYPLGSLPDEGQCPECATLYTRAQVVDLWKWSYKLKDRFPTQARDRNPEPLR